MSELFQEGSKVKAFGRECTVQKMDHGATNEDTSHLVLLDLGDGTDRYVTKDYLVSQNKAAAKPKKEKAVKEVQVEATTPAPEVEVKAAPAKAKAKAPAKKKAPGAKKKAGKKS